LPAPGFFKRGGMFTGIVQEIGVLRGRVPAGGAVRFTLDAPRLMARTSPIG
jgi:hypothetical protein